MNTHIAFLRGINVGGHHKLPMADLKKHLDKNGFRDVITLLNSGNVIFSHAEKDGVILEGILENLLESKFGFAVPTMVRSANEIQDLLEDEPFKGIEVHTNIRLYVSFIRRNNDRSIELPYESDDRSFRILSIKHNLIFSVLNLTNSSTPKAMEVLEKAYGKDITTRNWNTIERIGLKLTIDN